MFIANKNNNRIVNLLKATSIGYEEIDNEDCDGKWYLIEANFTEEDLLDSNSYQYPIELFGSADKEKTQKIWRFLKDHLTGRHCALGLDFSEIEVADGKTKK